MRRRAPPSGSPSGSPPSGSSSGLPSGLPFLPANVRERIGRHLRDAGDARSATTLVSLASADRASRRLHAPALESVKRVKRLARRWRADAVGVSSAAGVAGQRTIDVKRVEASVRDTIALMDDLDRARPGDLATVRRVIGKRQHGWTAEEDPEGGGEFIHIDSGLESVRTGDRVGLVSGSMSYHVPQKRVNVMGGTVRVDFSARHHVKMELMARRRMEPVIRFRGFRPQGRDTARVNVYVQAMLRAAVAAGYPKPREEFVFFE